MTNESPSQSETTSVDFFLFSSPRKKRKTSSFAREKKRERNALHFSPGYFFSFFLSYFLFLCSISCSKSLFPSVDGHFSLSTTPSIFAECTKMTLPVPPFVAEDGDGKIRSGSSKRGLPAENRNERRRKAAAIWHTHAHISYSLAVQHSNYIWYTAEARRIPERKVIKRSAVKARFNEWSRFAHFCAENRKTLGHREAALYFKSSLWVQYYSGFRLKEHG